MRGDVSCMGARRSRTHADANNLNSRDILTWSERNAALKILSLNPLKFVQRLSIKVSGLAKDTQ